MAEGKLASLALFVLVVGGEFWEFATKREGCKKRPANVRRGARRGPSGVCLLALCKAAIVGVWSFFSKWITMAVMLSRFSMPCFPIAATVANLHIMSNWGVFHPRQCCFSSLVKHIIGNLCSVQESSTATS